MKTIIELIVISFCLVVSSRSYVVNNFRIVGGDDATMGQFPHQISLQTDTGAHRCGGSIISDRFILTAAHCVVVGAGIEPYPPEYFRVRVGSVKHWAGGKLMHLKRIIVHQGYAEFLNDVALLELDQPLIWNKYIQAVDLTDVEVPGGEDVIVSGWGRTLTGGNIPYHLKWNTLQALTPEKCFEVLKFGNDSFICLDHEKGQGVCQGDSGGPALYKNKLVGVAGFVIGGCGSDNPDGYAKVFYHREWIMENIQK